MTTALIALAALVVGYAIGRYRPAHRMSDWAEWQKYDESMRRHSLCWWAMVIVLSTENVGWLLLHPIQGRRAWKHRDDPPPPRSPALTFDPDWAAKRRTPTEGTSP